MISRRESRATTPRRDFSHEPAADWRSEALCAEIGPLDELWMPRKGGSSTTAKEICGHCPVTEACLEWAMAHPSERGYWGGKSENERRAMRRRAQREDGAA
ncbi:MAG TPA: WhiB family transcriptional regulator [Phytomonospora sp.]